MDAVEFARERNRMCKAFGRSCCRCPIGLVHNVGTDCTKFFFERPEYVAGIVERWAKQNPVKTRQSEFLKQWPEALMTEDGLVNICPSRFVAGFRDEKGKCIQYCAKGCDNCRREFWLQEIG
nr:MAG TPA: hypothetical protein [Caudoviricetes sp.]